MTRLLFRILLAALLLYSIGFALTIWSLYELKADGCPVDSKVCV
jgi:hypothetical protein